ncbi:MAG TPA: biosynthetic-type acetolactate synthase large subunit [Limnochordia bacterium]|nr:biosynthetic-type acetolactate synthase large subunit [Limnochordia bacterium]
MSHPPRINASKLVVERLVAHGVKVVFGYPGGAILPVYDALYDSPIRHVLVRHEQAAAHMADGYARVTGRPGVCLATSGPGAINLATGIATAHMDSIPLIAITGNVPTSLIGTDAFQEADVTGITRPITKHNYLVKDAHDLVRIIDEAFHIATSGRPGPVLIDIPKDVAQAEVDAAEAFRRAERASLPVETSPSDGPTGLTRGTYRQLQRIAEAIAQAQRPVLYIGGGVITSGAHAEVLALAEKAQIPVTYTLMGIGAFPGDHPLALGMLGLHGTAYANYAVAKADLLIAVGARFDDRVTCRVDGFAKEATIVHIDIDAAEIGKVVPADIPAVGDAKAILSALLPLVAEKRHDEWLAQIAQWKEEYRLRYRTRPGVIAPQQVIEELYHVTRGEAICTADVGQHQMWLAQYYPFRQPRSHLSSGGLGTMGFGFPAAIGAKIALPHRSVWSIVGDGGMQMSLSELATVAAHRIPVKIAVLNNNSLGMVRQIQELSYQRRYIAVDLAGNPDFVAIAQAYGVAARRVDDPAELRPALEWAERYDGPMLLDIHIDPAANVYPMVPPGAAIDEMIGTKGYEETV